MLEIWIWILMLTQQALTEPSPQCLKLFKFFFYLLSVLHNQKYQWAVYSKSILNRISVHEAQGPCSWPGCLQERKQKNWISSSNLFHRHLQHDYFTVWSLVLCHQLRKSYKRRSFVSRSPRNLRRSVVKAHATSSWGIWGDVSVPDNGRSDVYIGVVFFGHK